jgi:hypothetical protein
MFKHVSEYPWVVGGSSVWSYPNKYGRSLIARCSNKNIPIETARTNARLIACAPLMYEIIQMMQFDEQAKSIVRFVENSDEN